MHGQPTPNSPIATQSPKLNFNLVGLWTVLCVVLLLIFNIGLCLVCAYAFDFFIFEASRSAALGARADRRAVHEFIRDDVGIGLFDDLCWGPWLQWPSIQSSKYLRPRYWPERLVLVHTAARPAGARAR